MPRPVPANVCAPHAQRVPGCRPWPGSLFLVRSVVSIPAPPHQAVFVSEGQLYGRPRGCMAGPPVLILQADCHERPSCVNTSFASLACKHPGRRVYLPALQPASFKDWGLSPSSLFSLPSYSGFEPVSLKSQGLQLPWQLPESMRNMPTSPPDSPAPAPPTHTHRTPRTHTF